jgi:hypothetical protein
MTAAVEGKPPTRGGRPGRAVHRGSKMPRLRRSLAQVERLPPHPQPLTRRLNPAGDQDACIGSAAVTSETATADVVSQDRPVHRDKR